jgi:hypothetical protein
MCFGTAPTTVRTAERRMGLKSPIEDEEKGAEHFAKIDFFTTKVLRQRSTPHLIIDYRPSSSKQSHNDPLQLAISDRLYKHINELFA